MGVQVGHHLLQDGREIESLVGHAVTVTAGVEDDEQRKGSGTKREQPSVSHSRLEVGLTRGWSSCARQTVA